MKLDKFNAAVRFSALALLISGSSFAASSATEMLDPMPEMVTSETTDEKAEKKIERKVVIVRDGKVFEFDGDHSPLPLPMHGGYLGISVVDLSSELREHYGVTKDAGVLVSKVADDSPASRAGIRVGDVITEIDGKKVATGWDVTRAVRSKKKDEILKIETMRNRAPMRLSATVIEKDAAESFRFRVNPQGRTLIGPEAKAAMERVGSLFNSPEWRARVEQFGDCGKVQERIKELEARLKEMEKKLEKK